MNTLTKLVVIASILWLTGCASTFPWLGGGTSSKVGQRFETFDYAGTSVYYRDLSSPCDMTSVAWADQESRTTKSKNDEQSIDCSVANIEKPKQVENQQWLVEKELSISFAMREKALVAESDQARLSELQSYRVGTTKFQIYGAAGFEGSRAEQLGLARAEYVKGQLLAMGVEDERIAIMPYDASIPGLQAVVKVLGAVVL